MSSGINGAIRPRAGVVFQNNMKTIIHTVQVHTQPETVYRALTTQAGVTGWWTDRATLDEGVNQSIDFSFVGDFNPRMLQTDLHPFDLVVWRCVSGHGNWKDNTFQFKLRESNGETSLQFVQEYAQELDDDTYGTYNFNWGYYLNSLKLFCETGTGTPFHA